MVVSFLYCKKKGCTDSEAKNYDLEASKDDGSCVQYSDQEKITLGTWTFSRANSSDPTLITSSENELSGRKITYSPSGTYSAVQNGVTTTGTWSLSSTNVNASSGGSEDLRDILIETNSSSNKSYYDVRTLKTTEIAMWPVTSLYNDLYATYVTYYYIR